MLKEGFHQVCYKAGQNGGDDWEKLSKSFRGEVRRWASNFTKPDDMLKGVEKELETLFSKPDQYDPELEERLQREYRIVFKNSQCWHGSV